MHFTEKFRVVVDKEESKVRLSVKVNEDVVSTYSCTIQEFEIMIAQYKAQIEEG